jgi:hypothetical protein
MAVTSLDLSLLIMQRRHVAGVFSRMKSQSPIVKQRGPREIALGTAAVGITIVVAYVLFSATCSGPQEFVSKVPPGSLLTELDAYLPAGVSDDSEVEEWIPKGKTPEGIINPNTKQLLRDDEVLNDTSGGLKVVTKFGTFGPRQLGIYSGWSASSKERNRFTGEIRFYEAGWSFRPDFPDTTIVNSLYYRDGKLWKTDWGYLPG